MTDQKFHAVLMPDGTIQLEWLAAVDRINQQSRLLQQEIHERYSSDAQDWFFCLGFNGYYLKQLTNSEVDGQDTANSKEQVFARTRCTLVFFTEQPPALQRLF